MSQGVLLDSLSSPPFAPSLARAPHHRASAPALPLTEARSRNEAIDILRVVAACSIVLVHAIESPRLNPFGNFWRFAVPFYLFASIYFQATSLRAKPDRSTIGYIGKRFVRLYFPFLVWSVIYTFARNIKRVAMIDHAPIELTPSLLWKGTEYHLWFLPFLLGLSITLVLVFTFVMKHARWLRWPLIVLFSLVGLAFALTPMPSGWNETFDNPTYAYVQWWRALPAGFGALAFALYMVAGEKVHRVTKRAAMIGLGLALVCCTIQWVHGPQMVARGFTGLGCILLTLAPWDTTGPIRAGLARVGRLGYGIYLNHVLGVEFIHAVTHKMHIPSSPALDLLNFAVSLGISTFIAWRLSKIPKLAWLNG